MTQTIKTLQDRIASDQRRIVILLETEKKQTKAAINDLLAVSGFSLSELFEDDYPRLSVYRPHPQHRQPGTKKFMKDGVTYDGRTARRAEAFADYMTKDGKLNMGKIVKAGLLNPEWLRDQSIQVVATLGIVNLTTYLKKHQMKGTE